MRPEDSTTGRRIGLHVDNFDRLPYPRRHQGRRRLCLNLGPGPRYLLIGDHDIQQICRMLHADLDRPHPHTEDIRRYVAAGYAALPAHPPRTGRRPHSSD